MPNKRKIRTAVIPAAGLGTRFLPATKAQPKEMLPIVDKPCIQYIIEEAIDSGIEDILIITGRNKRAIEDHFDRAVELYAQVVKAARPSYRGRPRTSAIIASWVASRASASLPVSRRQIA